MIILPIEFVFISEVFVTRLDKHAGSKGRFVTYKMYRLIARQKIR